MLVIESANAHVKGKRLPTSSEEYIGIIREHQFQTSLSALIRPS